MHKNNDPYPCQAIKMAGCACCVPVHAWHVIVGALLTATVCSAVVATKLTDSNHVWLLGEDSGYHDNYEYAYSSCDTTNVVALTKDRMHVDYFTTVEQLRMIRFNLPLPADFIQNRMINEEEQDEVFVAAHDGHMTINRFGNFTTFPIVIGKPSSLFMIESLACVTPASSTNILCVNVVKGTQKLCKDKIPPGSHGYTNIPTSSPAMPVLIYIVTPDHQTIMTFNVTDDCVTFLGAVAGCNYGNSMWFSNNGSRIFLSNGLSLNGLSLSPNSTFGSDPAGEYLYNSVSQMYSSEMLWKGFTTNIDRPIMALRDDVIDRLFFFEWPSLAANGTEAIPNPDGYSIVRPISLQYCQSDFAYALATYKNNKDSTLRTGVAYVKYYF